MSRDSSPAAFPLDGRRGIIYALDTRRRVIDEAARYAIDSLRPHAGFIALVSGPLDEDERLSIAPLVDQLIEVQGVLHGLWAHRAALPRLAQAAENFDELILTGDGWFGPVSRFEPTFERMDARFVDVWSLTDRRDLFVRGRGEGLDGPSTLSPLWLAVRKRALVSQTWHRFWKDLPPRPPADWHVQVVEGGFSTMMARGGFRLAAAFPSDGYPTNNPAFFNPDLMLRDGVPVINRDVFTGYPLFLDQFAIVGRRLAAQMAELGYPVDRLWASLARTVAPKTLNTNGGMLEVLPDVAVKELSAPPPRVVAHVHLGSADGVDELVRRVAWVPGLVSLAVSVDHDELEPLVREAWRQHVIADDIDIVFRPSAGPQTGEATLVFRQWADLLAAVDAELVLSVHNVVPAHTPRNTHRYLHRQQIESLLSTPGYIRNVLALFEREPGLGLVFPPTPHIGGSSLGDGWHGHRDDAVRLADDLDIMVPLDWASPHGPVGGMWIGRPASLRLIADMVRAQNTPAAVAVEAAMMALAAGEHGFHTRTVSTGEHAALSHDSLEYTADHMAMTMYGYPAGYTSLLHRAGPVGSGRGRDFLRMYLKYRRPRVWGAFARVGRLVRRVRGLTPSRMEER